MEHPVCEFYGKSMETEKTTQSEFPKSFISDILNTIKCVYWFNWKIITGSQRKTGKY